MREGYFVLLILSKWKVSKGHVQTIRFLLQMHPGYCGVEGASKESVSKCKVVVGAEVKKSLTIFVHFTQAMRSEHAIPLIVLCSNPIVKVSGKNQIIAFGNGRE